MTWSALARITPPRPDLLPERGVEVEEGRGALRPKWAVGTTPIDGHILLGAVAEDNAAYFTTINQDDGSLLNPTDGHKLKDLHLAVLISREAIGGIEAIMLDDLVYPLQPYPGGVGADGSILYQSTRTTGQFAARPSPTGATRSLFAVWGCLSGTGTQGEVLRRYVPINGRFLQGNSWAHVLLRQPSNYTGPDGDGVKGFDAIPEIRFVVRGVSMPPATDPSAAARLSSDATDVASWLLRERLRLPAADIDADSVTAAAPVTSARIRGADLDGTFWPWAPVPAGPDVDAASWVEARPNLTAALPVLWMAEALNIGSEPDRMASAGDRSWDRPRVHQIRLSDGTVQTIGQLNAAASFRRYQLAGISYAEPRYSVNGVIEGGSSRKVLDELNRTWQGFLSQGRDAKVRLLPGVDREVSFAWNAKNASSSSVSLADGPLETVNVVSGGIAASRVNGWREVGLRDVVDTAEVERAGVRRRERLEPFRFVTHPVTGIRLQTTFLRRTRQYTVYDYQVPLADESRWATASPGDVVTLTDTRRGLDARRTVVTDIQWSGNGQVSVTLVDTPVGAYGDDLDLDEPNEQPITPNSVPAVEGLALALAEVVGQDGSSRPRLAVSWTPVPYRTMIRIRARGLDAMPVRDLLPGEVGNVPFDGGTFYRSSTLGAIVLPEWWMPGSGDDSDHTDWWTIVVPAGTQPPFYVTERIAWGFTWEVQARHYSDRLLGPWSASVSSEVLSYAPDDPTLDDATLVVDGRDLHLHIPAPEDRTIAGVEVQSRVAADADWGNTRTIPVVPGKDVEAEWRVPSSVEFIQAARARWVTRTGRTTGWSELALAAPSSTARSGEVVFLTRDAVEADAGVRGRIYIRLISSTRARVWIDDGDDVTLIAVSPSELHALLPSGTDLDTYDDSGHITGALLLVEES